MLLQTCPNEIVHWILYFSVLSRGVRRALRLKLVCKFFRDALQPALFESRLLDTLASGLRDGIDEALRSTNTTYFTRSNSPYKLWHDYAAVRVATDSDPAFSRFAQVRCVARKFCEETGGNLDETITDLCWFASSGWFEEDTSQHAAEAVKSSGTIGDLLSVASYYGNMSLALELLNAVPVFMDSSIVLPSPMYMAAYTGNKELLSVFQERMPEFVKLGPNEGRDWRSKRGPGAILGAVRRGNMDILQLAMNPPTSTILRVRDHEELRSGLCDAISWCLPPTIEILEFLRANIGGLHYKWEVTRYARLGRADMVQHFLDNGIEVRGYQGPGGNILREAVRHCQWDVIDLLLTRGADMKFWDPIQDNRSPRNINSSTIVAAAQSGNVETMKKVFDLGAILDEPRRWRRFFLGHLALTAAVELEHAEMVELLLEKGAGDLFWPWFRRSESARVLRKKPLRRAIVLGLDSMVDLLRQKGITMESLTKDLWLVWHFEKPSMDYVGGFAADGVQSR
ncbi:hypothetical protein PG984_015694 [Apiospora sp. TS-2023a]